MDWDIFGECKNESPRDNTERWSLVQLNKAKREQKKELTTQGSRGLRELSKARVLTQET